jgi:hypothetical protein
VPLLWKGLEAPLEASDLSQAPASEAAKTQFDNFWSIWSRRARTSVVGSCLRQNCGLIVTAGMARFAADLFSLAGAVCIKLLVPIL